MQIREATEKDRAAVFNLATKLATSYAVSKQGFDQSFSTVLKLDHMLIAVAEDDDKICGYVLGNYNPCFYASGNAAWVAEILVQEPYRGQDIGRKLMHYFETWAKRNNCILVSLATRRAAPFYQAIGYEDSAAYFKKSL